MKPPNILWICADQQRYDTLGCTGNGFVQTPHVDGLAASGTLFERCYSQSPVCTPSRSSFLTGRYPRTTRCRQNGQSIPDDEVLVTRLLADAGYTCGLAGKLHLSACHPSACPAMERRIADGYHEFHWSHHPAPDWPTDGYNHWLRERGARFERRPFQGSKHVQVSVPAELHQTTWCVEKAIRFMEGNAEARRPRPWLFSINFFDPHHPFDPPEEYLRPYLDRLDTIPLPNYVPGELEQKPRFQQIDHRGAYGGNAGFTYDAMSPEDHRLVRAAYWAMVNLIDAQVGRLLAALEATGQRDDTLVIFMSDHGEMLGDHGIYLKGPYFYEPAVHVPLMLALPRGLAGEQPPIPRSRALVELVDLAPTLLDAAGLPRYAGMQGRSLWPLLRGETDPDTHRADIYCEYYNATPVHRAPPGNATMVRTERHKLVRLHGVESDTVRGELYDLEQDPGETVNLWDHPAMLSTRCDLMQRLCDRMAWTVDPLPEREGPF